VTCQTYQIMGLTPTLRKRRRARIGSRGESLEESFEMLNWSSCRAFMNRHVQLYCDSFMNRHAHSDDLCELSLLMSQPCYYPYVKIYLRSWICWLAWSKKIQVQIACLCTGIFFQLIPLILFNLFETIYPFPKFIGRSDHCLHFHVLNSTLFSGTQYATHCNLRNRN
jgi:hypothetical protein